MHHSDCLSQATFTFLVCVYNLQLNVIQQVSLCVQTRLSVLMFASAVRVTICAEGSEEKTATLQVRLQVLCCVKLALLSA